MVLALNLSVIMKRHRFVVTLLIILPFAPRVALATDVVGTGPQPKTAPAEANDGQWVYTQQYGWVWLGYARESTYITPEGYAYSYAYYPGNGWCWLYSPWVYGWGPAPHWGVRGRRYFVWYAHPWFARPAGPPRPAPRGGIRSGAHWGGGGFRGGMRGRR